MASIASVDKSLSRLSSWMSYAAFLGVVALAYLPQRAAPHTVAASTPAAVARPSSTSSPAQAASTGAQQPAPTAPIGAAPTPPPPDIWTPEEVAAGLRKCLQLLAPASVDIAIEEPMKHGQCGTPVPLLLHSIGTGDKVEFSPPPELNCRLAASLAEWVEKVLQPTAQQMLGARVKRIVGASSYACRNVYHNPKLALSEHATGNAIDIAGFVMADGRTITVARAWGPTERDVAEAKKKAAEKAGKVAEKPRAKEEGKATSTEATATPTPSIDEAGKKAEGKTKGHVVKADYKPDRERSDKTDKAERSEKAGKSDPAKVAAVDPSPPGPANSKEAAFLKRLHDGSCTVFATVLGPEANDAHRDHFHLDMKARELSGNVCH